MCIPRDSGSFHQQKTTYTVCHRIIEVCSQFFCSSCHLELNYGYKKYLPLDRHCEFNFNRMGREYTEWYHKPQDSGKPVSNHPRNLRIAWQFFSSKVWHDFCFQPSCRRNQLISRPFITICGDMYREYEIIYVWIHFQVVDTGQVNALHEWFSTFVRFSYSKEFNPSRIFTLIFAEFRLLSMQICLVKSALHFCS